MPGIDYRRVRALVPMRQVLHRIGFEPRRIRGGQLRGACPLQACRARRDPDFSVNVDRDIFQCFACGAAGDQIDLWARFRDLTDHEAALSLCLEFRVPVPWLRAWDR